MKNNLKVKLQEALDSLNTIRSEEWYVTLTKEELVYLLNIISPYNFLDWATKNNYSFSRDEDGMLFYSNKTNEHFTSERLYSMYLISINKER